MDSIKHLHSRDEFHRSTFGPRGEVGDRFVMSGVQNDRTLMPRPPMKGIRRAKEHYLRLLMQCRQVHGHAVHSNGQVALLDQARELH